MEIGNIFIEITVLLLCIVLGVFAGYSSVYCFNKLPEKWVLDYDQKPSEVFGNAERPRMKSYPWKPGLSMIFILILVKLMFENWQMGIPATLAIWIIIEIIFSDKIYKIIPDQLVILLALTGFGFVPTYKSFFQPILGIGVGILPMLIIYFLGKIIFKKEVLGFGDVKLMAAIGFLLGAEGVVFTFVTAFLTSGLYFAIALLMKKIKLNDEEPLGPFIGLAAITYLVFYNDLHMFLNIV